MLKYSSRAGKVLEIKREKVKIELFSSDLPLECEAKGCRICKSRSPKVERFYDKSAFSGEIAINDIVKIESRQIEDGFAAAILFLTPIAFAAVFYCAAISAKFSDESVFSILFTVLGGIFGFVLVFVFDKIFCGINPPKIIKE